MGVFFSSLEIPTNDHFGRSATHGRLHAVAPGNSTGLGPFPARMAGVCRAPPLDNSGQIPLKLPLRRDYSSAHQHPNS